MANQAAMDGATGSNVTDLGGVVHRILDSHLTPSPPAMSVAKVIVGVTGIVGNMLVVIVFIKYQELFRHVKTTLIINQSMIDGFASVVLIVATFVTTDLYTGELYCKLWASQILLWGLMMSSTYNLMAISIERFLAVAYPMWHRVTVTNTKTNVVAVLIWMIGVPFIASFVVPSTTLVQGKCLVSCGWPSRAAARAVGFTQMFFNLVMPICVHLFCYTRMLLTLRKRMTIVHPEYYFGSNASRGKTRAITGTLTTTCVTTINIGGASRIPHDSTSTSRQTLSTKLFVPAYPVSGVPDRQKGLLETQIEKAKMNAIKTLTIITACYFICWIPNKLYVILYMLGQISTFGDIFHATVILVFTNCCINPIIFIGTSHAFRSGLAMLFRCPR